MRSYPFYSFDKPIKMKCILSLLVAGTLVLAASAQPAARTKHLFVITIDGFRWQEIFTGADPQLVANPEYVRDTALTKGMYWDSTAELRRKRLLPFFWGTLAQRGRLYGNRLYGNKVNVRNFYKISYPGYNEIFTGHTDAISSPNIPINNKHVNVLEYLNGSSAYHGKVAIFTSWSVFPYILNEARSGLPVNSGYERLDEGGNDEAGLIDSVMATMHQTKTRHDYLTFCTAREYMRLPSSFRPLPGFWRDG